MRFTRILAVAVLLCAASLAGGARASVTLDFDGLQDFEAVLNYYDGGYGSRGSGPGPDYGISFNSQAWVLLSNEGGGSGNFIKNPSGDSVGLGILGRDVVMSSRSGFVTKLSFWYAALFDPGTATIYDQMHATGNELAHLELPALGYDIDPEDPDAVVVNRWAHVEMYFDGIARSVTFNGEVFIAIDDITLLLYEPLAPPIDDTPLPPGDSATVVMHNPEASSLVMWGLLASGAGAAVVRNRRRGANALIARAA
jgi:hypothetical protein